MDNGSAMEEVTSMKKHTLLTIFRSISNRDDVIIPGGMIRFVGGDMLLAWTLKEMIFLSELNQDDWFYEEDADLMRRLHLTRYTVRKYIAALVRLGLFFGERRPKPGAASGTVSWYRLNTDLLEDIIADWDVEGAARIFMDAIQEDAPDEEAADSLPAMPEPPKTPKPRKARTPKANQDGIDPHAVNTLRTWWMERRGYLVGHAQYGKQIREYLIRTTNDLGWSIEESIERFQALECYMVPNVTSDNRMMYGIPWLTNQMKVWWQEHGQRRERQDEPADLLSGLNLERVAVLAQQLRSVLDRDGYLLLDVGGTRPVRIEPRDDGLYVEGQFLCT